MSKIADALRLSLVLLALVLSFTPLLAQESAEHVAACPMATDGSHDCACRHAMHGGELPDGQGGMRLFERMSTDLALTENQKQEIGALMEMYRPRIQELAKRTRSTGEALFEVAPDDPSYNTRATELSERAGATASEIVTLLAELQASAYALLTAEQQAKYLQLRAERRERIEQMRARIQERRERGDWQPGMHLRHKKCPEHCVTGSIPGDDVPPAGDN